MENFTSDLSGKNFPFNDRVSAALIRPSILQIIQRDHPHFTDEHYCAISELNFYREKYLSELMGKELHEMTNLRDTVLESLRSQTTLTSKLENDEVTPLTTGQRIADMVAAFGGSWTFIISFGVFIVIWISANTYWFFHRAFDPYPFILLNLILSCIAALQAPIIMMSQNRQEEKDRERSKKDFMINLKSELEIRMLHEKIDHLIMHQQQELIEIQKVQVDMMNDILERVRGGRGER